MIQYHAGITIGHFQIGQTLPLTIHAPLKKHCPCGQILTWESIEKLRGHQGVFFLQPLEFAKGLVNRQIPKGILTCGCLWEACRHAGDRGLTELTPRSDPWHVVHQNTLSTKTTSISRKSSNISTLLTFQSFPHCNPLPALQHSRSS